VKNKKPRFFCDNCGSEVDRNARACPQCGRLLAAVRCPSCGFTGEESDFTNGCPSCGYSSPPPVALPTEVSQSPEKKVPAKPLPFWMYILTIITFIGILAILYIRFFH
jgi:uncharacterized membrane protein YvbJ